MSKKNKKKRGKKIMKVILIIIVILTILMFIGFIINSILSKGELEQIEPYGKMINVEGKNMHVNSMGNGSETIVLLPGFGVSLPSADFGPLMRELSKKYTVATIEYFGVGFSDEIDTPRTNENYTHEIRTALQKAGFTPPYILMPHSISGINAEYYASRYPDEIKGLILLDTTSTSKEVLESIPSYMNRLENIGFSIGKFQQKIGMTRLGMKLVPDTKLVENGYTEKEISDYKKFSNHVINNTIISQSLSKANNIKETSSLDFPEDIPVIKLISSETLKNMAKKNKDDGMSYHTEHLKRLGKNTSYKVIEASHFMYQTKVSEISDITDEFIDTLEQQ